MCFERHCICFKWIGAYNILTAHCAISWLVPASLQPLSTILHPSKNCHAPLHNYAKVHHSYIEHVANAEAIEEDDGHVVGRVPQHDMSI